VLGLQVHAIYMLHLLQAGAVCSVLFLLSYTWVHVQLLLVHACLIWDRHV